METTGTTAATATRITGRFTFSDWQEDPITPAGEGGPRLARASVVNAFTGGIEAAPTSCAYTIVYISETTGSFTGMQVFTGAVDGRTGSFAVAERGSFAEDTTLTCTFEVVPGSGTGELAGLRGSGGFTTRHGEESVPYAFHYDFRHDLRHDLRHDPEPRP